MPEDFEVISALLDGEDVDLEQLDIAIEKPAGRQALLDFVRVREASAADQPTPRREFYERLQMRRLNGQSVGVPLPYAAAAMLLALLLGSFFNIDSFKDRTASEPPEATRVLTFEPGVDWSPERSAP